MPIIHRRPIHKTVLVLLSSLFVVCTVMAAAEDFSVSRPYGPPPETIEYTGDLSRGKIYYVKASPEKGFHWPYYFTVPEDVTQPAPILMQPNNDGQVGINRRSREYFASIINEQAALDFGRPLGAVVLTPVFPRPALQTRDGNLYVHALTRETLLDDSDTLSRVDLQLLAMSEDLRAVLARHNITSDDQLLLWGFSAAGDFVSRFAVLHPGKVKAVAAGGMGGFPILPVAEYANARLDYPVGVADLAHVSGSPFDLHRFRQVPVLYIQGADDENDSVVANAGQIAKDEYGSDSYSQEQAVFINSNFGERPADRLEKVIEIYDTVGMQDFSYISLPGVKHKDRPLKPMVLDFFRRVQAEDN